MDTNLNAVNTHPDPDLESFKDDLAWRGVLEPLRESIRLDAPEIPASKVDQSWTALRRRMDARVEPANKISRRSGGRSLNWIVIGASLAILVAAVTLITRWNHGTVPESIATYSTTPGQISKLRLPDGSTLTLAPATTVKISPNSATVQGEAYFQIIPQPNRSFTVRTRNAIVRVLGTKFTVRQYPSDLDSRVAVEDGKVTVQAATLSQASKILAARTIARITDSAIVVTPNMEIRNYIDWMNGRLTFNEAALREVIPELARAYGADIRLADTLVANKRITMVASVDTQPLSRVLDLLTIATETHYVRTGNVIVIAPGRNALHIRKSDRFPQLEKSYGR